jgi:hypothetical protein
MAAVHFTAAASALLLAGCAHLNQPACAPSSGLDASIERTVHAFFDALRREDMAAFRQLTTSSFYSFDVGKRYAGTELVDVVKDAHRRGVQLHWSIGEMDTNVACNVAWSAWENVGSAGIPPDVKPVRWLESAVLVRENGSWKVDFFHSQRAAPE